MNKTKTILVIMLLLSFSIVSAYNVEEQLERTKDVPQNIIARWYWRLLQRYSDLIQERNELQARIDYLEANPITITKRRTRTITNIEYVVCDDCPIIYACLPPKVYKDDGKDMCGCAINPRCVDDIKPVKPIFIGIH